MTERQHFQRASGVTCAILCGMRPVRGAIRWARGQGAGILATLEALDGDSAQLPVATALTRASGLDQLLRTS